MSKPQYALFMERTKIEPDRTIADIQKELKKYGLRRFNVVYGDDGEIEAVAFTLRGAVPGTDMTGADYPEMPYKLPARWEPLLGMATEGLTKYLKPDDLDQARRIAWRQIYRWIQAQLALVEVRMVTTAEVFLPYMMVDGSETTMYEKLVETKFQGHLLTEGKRP